MLKTTTSNPRNPKQSHCDFWFQLPITWPIHPSSYPSIHPPSLPCGPVLPYPSRPRQKRTHMQRVINSLAQSFHCFSPMKGVLVSPSWRSQMNSSPGSLGLFEEPPWPNDSRGLLPRPRVLARPVAQSQERFKYQWLFEVYSKRLMWPITQCIPFPMLYQLIVLWNKAGGSLRQEEVTAPWEHHDCRSN